MLRQQLLYCMKQLPCCGKTKILKELLANQPNLYSEEKKRFFFFLCCFFFFNEEVNLPSSQEEAAISIFTAFYIMMSLKRQLNHQTCAQKLCSDMHDHETRVVHGEVSPSKTKKFTL